MNIGPNVSFGKTIIITADAQKKEKAREFAKKIADQHPSSIMVGPHNWQREGEEVRFRILNDERTKDATNLLKLLGIPYRAT